MHLAFYAPFSSIDPLPPSLLYEYNPYREGRDAPDIQMHPGLVLADLGEFLIHSHCLESIIQFLTGICEEKILDSWVARWDCHAGG